MTFHSNTLNFSFFIFIPSSSAFWPKPVFPKASSFKGRLVSRAALPPRSWAPALSVNERSVAMPLCRSLVCEWKKCGNAPVQVTCLWMKEAWQCPCAGHLSVNERSVAMPLCRSLSVNERSVAMPLCRSLVCEWKKCGNAPVQVTVCEWKKRGNAPVQVTACEWKKCGNAPVQVTRWRSTFVPRWIINQLDLLSLVSVSRNLGRVLLCFHCIG